MLSVSAGVSSNPSHNVQTRKRSHAESLPEPDPLHSVGYKVFKAAVKITDPLLQETIKRSEDADAIFNHNEKTPRNDHKQRQCKLTANKSSKNMKEFMQRLNGFLSDNVSKVLTPAPWFVIHSRPNCQDQAAHCDYVPNPSLGTVPDERMPLAALVSMMPGTTLNVWPKSIRLSTLNEALVEQIPSIKCRVVKLNAGDMIVFRGDLVHAGSSYKKDNYRLHTFLDSDAVERKPNSTWIVHKHGSESIRKVILPK